jgi:HAD superfamily hydrolase (TIGR01549 family)
MSPSDVRGISFDLGGTVIDNPRAATAELAALVGVDLASMRTYLRQEKARRSPVPLLAEAIANDFLRPELAAELAELLDRLRAATAETVLLPDAEATLKELRRRGYRIAFLSNLLGAIAPEQFDDLLGLADVVLMSCDTGHVKPDAAAFAGAAAALDLPAHAMLHVGDSWGADVEGALDAGLRAVHVAPSAAGARPLRHPRPGYWGSISQLTELLGMFDGVDSADAVGQTQVPERRRDPYTGETIPARGWCEDGRLDPITGLIAFPDFHAALPPLLVSAAGRRRSVGLAIGDVDNLKMYVENANNTDPASFGHLAGCAVMTQLGAVARQWFDRYDFSRACVSTFGGDEIIIAAEVTEADAFAAAITELAYQLRTQLPRPVSFAFAIATPEQFGDIGEANPIDTCTRILASVDRFLFVTKADNRARQHPVEGFVARADLNVDQLATAAGVATI